MNKLFLLVLLSFNTAYAKDDVLEIKLSSKGNDIAFDITSFQVPFGKDLVLKFANSANKDSEIIHNIAILAPGSLEEVLKAFEDSDYDVEKLKNHKSVLAMTPSLEPGQSANLKLEKSKFTKPGFYPYICLIPGHADMLGMKGLMHIKEKKS